jgi:hypothetical protein
MHFGDGTERVVVIDMKREVALRAEFKVEPVDPHDTGPDDSCRLRRRGLGSGKGGSDASTGPDDRMGKSSSPLKMVRVAISGLGQMIGQ